MENLTENKTKIYLIWTLLLVLFPFRSLAKTFEDLYIAEVLVPNETSRELFAGSRAGLAQVLVRVSGSRAIQQSKVIVEALKKSDSYYYKYGYEYEQWWIILKFSKNIKLFNTVKQWLC